VREGAFYLLLAPVVGGGLITVAALAMRLWNIIGEVIMALICFVVERRIGLPLTTTSVEMTLKKSS
jgi:hypothetical protein